MVSLRSYLAGALIAASLALASITSTHAEPPPQDAIVNRWIDAQSDIKTWSADFVQTRSLKTFSQPLMSTGLVWFAAPHNFRWEIGSPAQTIVVREAHSMTIVYPKLKRVEKYPLDAKQTGQWKDMLSLLEAGFPRDRKDLDTRFDIKSLEAKGETWEINLQPKSASARRMMPRLAVAFHTNTFTLTATELEFADGSTMRNEFRNGKVNTPLAPDVFKFDVPAEYRVVEPLSSNKVLFK